MKKNILIYTFFLVICTTNAQSILPFSGLSNDLKSERAADKLWKNGDFAEAEKLYYKSYNNSKDYTMPLLKLATQKFEIGDSKGGNKVFDDVLNHQYSKYYLNARLVKSSNYYFKIDKNLNGGDTDELINTTLRYINFIGEKASLEENKYLKIIYYNVCKAAFDIEDQDALFKLHDGVSKIKNAEYCEFVSFMYMCILNKEYDQAFQRIDLVLKNGGFQYSFATAKYFSSLVYTYKGEYEKALESIEEAKKSILLGEDDFNAIYGMISLNKKDYKDAIDRLTKALAGKTFLFIRQEPKDKFKLYSLRAHAYIGLGEPLNAKKDFESSLTYNPNFQPSIDGIAELEGKIIANIKTDKTPPSIVITEPSTQRGLSVVSALNDIMVKGTAKDLSGLKSVSINGEVIYSKGEGDFWGNITLIEGLNKINIIAIDNAGNSSNQVLEIERNSKATTNDIVPVNTKEGKNYILLIASQNYEDIAINSLENPIADAIKLKLVLKNKYNFNEENIITAFNPERLDFKKKFIQLSEILEPEDNLIIFYAGHGTWIDKEKKGYWLPTDAKRNDVNTWISNKEVLEMISSISCRHTLLITDACFSGGVFKTRSIGKDAPANIKTMNEKISRVAITSGNDTEVPDESVFMKYLVKALSENKETYLTAQKMFITQIMEAVMTETKTEPRYGTLELAGHIGGDYIFMKK